MSQLLFAPRRFAGFTLALLLWPPALAQSVHLAPADLVGSAEVRLHDAVPGQRVLLFDQDSALCPSGARREVTTGASLDVRSVARSGGLGHLVAVGEADPEGSVRIVLPSAAFSGRTQLAVAVVGQGTVTVVATLRLPGTMPIVPRLSNSQSREVLVTEFMKDPAAVSDTRGEWIEFFNTTLSPIDIEGWVLTDDGSDRTVLQNGGNGIVVPARSFVVLGRNADPNLNGGVSLTATYTGMTLANGTDAIILSRPNGQLSDAVRYLSNATWPNRPGASLSLSIRAWFTGHDDVARGWCEGRTPMPMGDLGTPGQLNDECL